MEVFLAAVLGALLQEGLWWYNRRRTLTEEKYGEMIGSPVLYFSVVVGFTVLTGLVALVWFKGQVVQAKDAMVFGAFMPAIIKQAAPGGVRPMGASKGGAGFFKSYLGS